MLKEQIAEVFREALKSQIDSCLELYGETGMNYPNLQPNDRELGYYADQIIACFQDDYMDEPLHEIINQEWEKAHAVELALKEQMERVIGVIEEKMEKLTSQINSYQCPQQVPTAYLAQLYALDALKAELEANRE